MKYFYWHIEIFSDSPACAAGQQFVYEVAKMSTVHVTCDMDSNPETDVNFRWTFNTSANTVDIPVRRKKLMSTIFYIVNITLFEVVDKLFCSSNFVKCPHVRSTTTNCIILTSNSDSLAAGFTSILKYWDQNFYFLTIPNLC